MHRSFLDGQAHLSCFQKACRGVQMEANERSFLLTTPNPPPPARISEVVSDWVKFTRTWFKSLRRLLFRLSSMVCVCACVCVCVGGGGGGDVNRKDQWIFIQSYVNILQACIEFMPKTFYRTLSFLWHKLKLQLWINFGSKMEKKYFQPKLRKLVPIGASLLKIISSLGFSFYYIYHQLWMEQFLLQTCFIQFVSILLFSLKSLFFLVDGHHL